MQLRFLKKFCAAILFLTIALSSCISFAAQTDAQIVADGLYFDDISNHQDITAVETGFDLSVEKDGAFIVWESDNENVLYIEGDSIGLRAIVVRPPFGEGNATAKLTAHVTKNGTYAKKEFLLRIKELDIGFTYSRTVQDAYDIIEKHIISKQDISDIRQDLSLPEKSEFGQVDVRYVSDNPRIISNEGKVTRGFDDDASVNLYVYFTEGFESFKTNYRLTVKAYEETEIASILQAIRKSITDELQTKYNTNGLRENITLPQTLDGKTIIWGDSKTITVSGSHITWSSDSSAITDKGVVTRGESDVSANLIFTVAFNGKTETGTLTVTIARALAVPAPVPDTSPGPFGGSGGTDRPITNQLLFNDVPTTHWAYSAITALAKEGVINGVGNKLFAPDSLLTREQGVKMILPAMSIYVNTDMKSSVFTDCISGEWYVPYVEAARERGIVQGVSETCFGVGKNITRQELTVIIYRVMKEWEVSLSENSPISFSDSDAVAPWAQEAVNALSSAGIINGKGENFAPTDNATRAEAVAIIYRASQLLDID